MEPLPCPARPLCAGLSALAVATATMLTATAAMTAMPKIFVRAFIFVPPETGAPATQAPAQVDRPYARPGTKAMTPSVVIQSPDRRLPLRLMPRTSVAAAVAFFRDATYFPSAVRRGSAQPELLLVVVHLGRDGCRSLSRDQMLRDLLVAHERTLQLLDHPVLGNRDDGRRARRQAVADLFQVGVLEALVADLAPHAPGAPADGGRQDDAGREDQADHSAGNRPALCPLLAARISCLVELDLAIGAMDDHGRVDQVDGTVPLRPLESLRRLSCPVLAVVCRNEDLDGAGTHVTPRCVYWPRAA